MSIQIQNEVLAAMKTINDEIIKLVGMAVAVSTPAPAQAKPSFDKEELFKDGSVLVVQHTGTFNHLDGPEIQAFVVTGRVAGKAKHAEAFGSKEAAYAASESLDTCSVWETPVKMAQSGGSLWGRKPYAYMSSKKLLFRRRGTKITFEEVFYSLA